MAHSSEGWDIKERGVGICSSLVSSYGRKTRRPNTRDSLTLWQTVLAITKLALQLTNAIRLLICIWRLNPMTRTPPTRPHYKYNLRNFFSSIAYFYLPYKITTVLKLVDVFHLLIFIILPTCLLLWKYLVFVKMWYRLFWIYFSTSDLTQEKFYSSFL